jgi:hypothetical protein
MWTKAYLINFMLRKMGIASGVQSAIPNPDMVASALADYEPMVSEFAQKMSIRPYKTDPPDVSDFTGLSDEASLAMAYQLGLRVASDYLIEPTPAYTRIASETLENLMNNLLVVPEMQRRNDMPSGAGWKNYYRAGAFYHQSNVVGGSIVQATGDTQTYSVDFTGELLAGESVTSVNLRSKSSNATVTDVVLLAGNVVSYRVSFDMIGLGFVALQAAGDQNTVATIKVDFDVRGVPHG